eukprot:m.135286 g.135286  ORF g.135286 m.135286 type:complete len:90 (-) comp16940_c0_seq8:439-708(-)
MRMCESRGPVEADIDRGTDGDGTAMVASQQPPTSPPAPKPPWQVTCAAAWPQRLGFSTLYDRAGPTPVSLPKRGGARRQTKPGGTSGTR